MNNRTKELEARRFYVESVLGAALEAKTGFESIKYACERPIDSEYVRISDLRGTSVTIDVTGEPLEKIMADVFRIALPGTADKFHTPVKIITDWDTLLKIAPLFR